MKWTQSPPLHELCVCTHAALGGPLLPEDIPACGCGLLLRLSQGPTACCHLGPCCFQNNEDLLVCLAVRGNGGATHPKRIVTGVSEGGRGQRGGPWAELSRRPGGAEDCAVVMAAGRHKRLSFQAQRMPDGLNAGHDQIVRLPRCRMEKQGPPPNRTPGFRGWSWGSRADWVSCLNCSRPTSPTEQGGLSLSRSFGVFALYFPWGDNYLQR